MKIASIQETPLYYLEDCLGVPADYTRKILEYNCRVPVNIPLNYTKTPLTAHIYASALFHIFSNPAFEKVTLSCTILPVLGLMAREGVEFQSNCACIMVGNDTEQQCKLWRYFFSAYLYSRNLINVCGLSDFLMLVVDGSTSLSNSFQRDVFLYYIFDFLLCGVKYDFDFAMVLYYAKYHLSSLSCVENIVALEQLKQKLTCEHQASGADRLNEHVLPSEIIANVLSAFFKITPDLWAKFACYLQHKNYSALDRLVFGSAVDCPVRAWQAC